MHLHGICADSTKPGPRNVVFEVSSLTRLIPNTMHFAIASCQHSLCCGTLNLRIGIDLGVS